MSATYQLSPDERRCTRCRTPKPLDNFYRKGTGYQDWCKTCKTDYERNKSGKPPLPSTTIPRQPSPALQAASFVIQRPAATAEAPVAPTAPETGSREDALTFAIAKLIELGAQVAELTTERDDFKRAMYARTGERDAAIKRAELAEATDNDQCRAIKDLRDDLELERMAVAELTERIKVFEAMPIAPPVPEPPKGLNASEFETLANFGYRPAS